MTIKRPEDEQTKSGTMNVLGPQSAQQSDMSSEAPNQGINVSGPASATAGSPQGQQALNQPKKGVGSGQAPMYQKYVQAGKDQAGRMASDASQKFGQQAGTVAQAIQQKRDKFSEQVAQNRAGIQQAQQFGQQAMRQASQAEDMQDLQRQQIELQARRDSLGQMQEGGYQQQIQQQQQQMAQQQQQYDAAQQQVDAMAQQRQQFANLRPQIASYIGRNEDALDQGMIDRAYQQSLEAYQEGREEPFDLEALRTQQAEADQAFQEAMSQGGNFFAAIPDNEYFKRQKLLNLSDYNRLNQELADIRPLQQQARELERALPQEQLRLEALENMQRQFERGGQLDQELSDLEARMANAPETLTDEDVDRFRRLAEGRERYDQLAFNVAQQQRQTEEMGAMARDVERGETRRRILRDALAGGSEYTRGEAALDEAIIQSDPEARRQLVENVQATGRGLEDQLRSARRSSLQEMGELQADNRQLIETLNTQVDEGSQALKAELDRRVETGEGTYLDALRNAVSEGTISAEQAEQLGVSGGSLYGADVAGRLEDLSGLATRESVASRSELARAQALARLAGLSEQDTFASPDTVGQMSQAERGRLLEARGDIEAAQRDYNQQMAAQQAAFNRSQRRGDMGSIGSYISSNTQSVLGRAQDLINRRGGIENLSLADADAIDRAITHQGSGHAAWGMGDLRDMYNRQQAMNEMVRQQRPELLVEGTDIAQQEQANLAADRNRQARMEALRMLSQGPRTGAGRNLYTGVGTREAKRRALT